MKIAIRKFRRYGILAGAKKILFILLAGLLMMGCMKSQTEKKIGDGGFISGKPCSAPCFFGIVPGQSDRDQAINQLRKLGVKYSRDANQMVNYSNLVFIKYNSNGLVTEIIFRPSTKIKVKDILDVYGPPDKVEILYDPSSTPEHNYFDSNIFYNGIHLIITLQRQENWPGYSLTSETDLGLIIYDEATVYNNQVYSTHIIPWKGYGLYQDPNPVHFP
jgi:hypothetical protein